MIESHLRAPTDGERHFLAQLAGADQSDVAWNAALVFALGVVIGGLGLRLLGVPKPFLQLLAFGFGALAAVDVHLRSRTAALRRSGRYAEDIALDETEETRYRTREAIKVEEFEDEGSAYYLLLEDGRVLFLMGQYLYEAEEEGRFPCTEFVIGRIPRSRLVLDLRCLGTPFAPSDVQGHFTEAEFRGDQVPEDGAVLEIDFARPRERGRAAR